MKKIFLIGLIVSSVVFEGMIQVNAENISQKETNKTKIVQTKSHLDNCKVVVARFYEGFYGRNADSDGLYHWSSEIASGRRTVAQVIESFVSSKEFKNKDYNNEEFIKAVYKGLFGRNVDKSGLNYWTSLLKDGASKNYILQKNIESNEYINFLNQLHIKNKGSIHLTVKDKKNEVKDLIRDLYSGLYNRDSDAKGVEYWSNQILDEKLSVANVIEKFIFSEEMKNKNYNNKEFVVATYKGILGRNPDINGEKYWVDCLKRGNSRKLVVREVFESKEYQNRIDNIGIKNKGKFIIDINDKKGDVRAVISNLYEGFHGRKADSEGLKYWSNKILTGEDSVAQIVESFAYSKEFVEKEYTMTEYVQAIYKGINGRDPDSKGMNYWLSQLIDGKSKRFVLSSIFESQEFQDKLRSLGVKKIGKIHLSDKDLQSTVAKAKIINATMNLRSEPSLDSKVLTTMKPGSEVVVLGRVKGDLSYYSVKYVDNGKIYEGYVSMYLSGTTVVQIYKDNLNNDFLGVISEKYESNGNPGSISSGIGDYGGKSYGAWQFSSKMGSLDGFVNWLKDEKYSFYKKLIDARNKDNNTNCGPEFDKAWRELAKNNYNTFYTLQHKYVKQEYYDKLMSRLVRVGDFSDVLSSFAVRNTIWSTVVQHGVGGAYSIIAPLKNVDSSKDFINSIYAERGRKDKNGVLVHFYSSSPAVQAGVAKRFKNENREALQVLSYEN